MKETVFVLGGCRSGKSRHALELASQRVAKEKPGGRKTFIATCTPLDEEMERRVDKHQEERGPDWRTVEAPAALPEAIAENSLSSDVIVADCLTLWVSNLMLEGNSPEDIEKYAAKLVEAVGEAQCPVILVSNEVGSGIVPGNQLARLFRDAVGTVNQSVAKNADKVFWMVAGIPVAIKE